MIVDAAVPEYASGPGWANEPLWIVVSRFGNLRQSTPVNFSKERAVTRKSTNVTNLTLSRRPGETVVLDGPGTVRIVHSSGRRVKLIIAAPAETRVLRGELCISSAATIDEFGDPA